MASTRRRSQLAADTTRRRSQLAADTTRRRTQLATDTTRRQIPIYRVQPAMGFGYKQLNVLILKSDHSENTHGKTKKLGIDPISYQVRISHTKN